MSSPDVRIHEWSDDDLVSVRQIAWETWLATYGSFIPERDIKAYFDDQYSHAALRQYRARPATSGFVSECGKRAVGFARTEFNEEQQRFSLGSLYVLPAFQGKGIGSALLRACEGRALEFGATEIWLGVMKQNTAAMEWYKRLGFTFPEEAPFTMGETTVTHLIGSRKIERTRRHGKISRQST